MEIKGENKIVDIALVKPNSYNPKPDFHKDEVAKIAYTKIKKSLKEHGQIEPIIVRQLDDNTYEIINGYHRYEAAKELGSKQIEIKNLGKITRPDAIFKALTTERTKVEIDDIEEAKLLKELSKDIPLVDLEKYLPYDLSQINAKIDLLQFDFDSFKNTEEEDQYPDGMKTLNVPMTEPQYKIVKEAIQRVKDSEQQDFSDGRCLELICADYLAGK